MTDTIYKLVHGCELLMPTDKVLSVHTANSVTGQKGDQLFNSKYGYYSATEIRQGLYGGWIVPA